MTLRNLLLPVPFLLAACQMPGKPDYTQPLRPGAPALIPVEPGEPLPDFSADFYERAEILPALDRSIDWMRRPSSERFFPVEDVPFDRALASLERFRAILAASGSAAEFASQIDDEFQVYKSAGWDGRGGGVLFTGYCTPILEGRLAPDATFQWPVYGLPPDLVKGEAGEILGRRTANGVVPYPTRRAIEASALLEGQGLELAWLANPIDAFIAHVNGSAFIRIADGSLHRLGYAGKNGRQYTSLGAELIKDGELPADGVSLAAIRRWAEENPSKVDEYLQRNDSFVFFTTIEGNPRGSLNVEVSAGRTVATDKTLFPRGAIVYVDTKYGNRYGGQFHRFMLDQDTGGAIRTAGRADLYLGIGDDAEELAGRTKVEGQMYYLFLKDLPET